MVKIPIGNLVATALDQYLTCDKISIAYIITCIFFYSRDFTANDRNGSRKDSDVSQG